MKKIFYLLAFLWMCESAQSQTIKILFDATKAETAGNADWVVDADVYNLGWSTGPGIVGGGNEANAQRYPTPPATLGQTYAENYWKGGLSYWGLDCIKKGYDVETLPFGSSITYGDGSNPQDLSYYKVFVVCEPNIQFTTVEKTAILNFVNSGGGLFMISDHDVSDRNNDGWDSPRIWDDLMQSNTTGNSNPFGIQFNRLVSTTIDNFSETSSNVNQALSANDSILHGSWGNVSMVKWSNGTSMTLDPVANNSVRAVFYQTAVGTPPSGNNQVMVAYSRYGSGKIVAIGDSSPCDDGTGDTGDNLFPGYMGDVPPNHRNLLMNGTIWLATNNSVAPVTLTTFNATLNNGKVVLKWTVENQVNIMEYDVERSTDGSNFQPIGRVTTTGNNQNQVIYNFIDPSIPAKHIIYYRLKIVETSGTYNYSYIRKIDLPDQKANSVILKNSPGGKATLVINLSVGEKIYITVLTVEGKSLEMQTVDHIAGKQFVALDLPGLCAGMYIVKVQSLNINVSLPLIVQ